MTPQRALEILDAAAARALLTRAEHFAVAEAVETIRRFLTEQTDRACEGK